MHRYMQVVVHQTDPPGAEMHIDDFPFPQEYIGLVLAVITESNTPEKPHIFLGQYRRISVFIKAS